MPIHLRELPKGQRFVLTRTGDKFAYLDHSYHITDATRSLN